MREITMPEVKLPDIKLPDALRDMNRDDIVRAAHDVRDSFPKRIDMPDIDLSKVELPKQIADRLPNRKRTNPLLPIAGLLAVGAAIAAAWWLITSPITGPRVRRGVTDLKNRLTGESTDLVRYDNEADLGSLLTDETAARASVTSDPPASSVTDLGNGAPMRPKATQGVSAH